MKTESGSSQISIPIFRSPAESHVHSVDDTSRSSGSRSSSPTKTTTEHANDTSTEAAATIPAPRREILSPSSARTTTATAGEKSAIQPASVTGVLGWGGGGSWSRQPFRSVSLSTSSSIRRRDIATIRPRPITASDAATTMTASAKIWPPPSPRYRENAISDEVAGVEHELEREQDDQRAAADQHAERPDREEHDREDEVGGDPRAEH